MEFSELFTQSARELLAYTRGKKLVSYFDYRGPLIDMPRNDPRLRSGIFRILLGLVDCMDTGFVIFGAHVQQPESGASTVVVEAAGTGANGPGAVENVMRRLGLESDQFAEVGPGGAICRGKGTCPSTGGKVVFVSNGAEGSRISLEMRLMAVERLPRKALHDAAGAEAWLVSSIPGALDSLSRRLVRQGWCARPIESLEQAANLMGGEDAGDPSPPHLLVVAESTEDDLPQLERLALFFPALWTVLGVVTGSTTLRMRGKTSADIRVLPLSPLEVDYLTAHVDGTTSTANSRTTAPAPLYVQGRRLVLVVDDNAINQMLADGMLDVLGYDVSSAFNGVDAIEACLRNPPDVVLMDVHMPVMDGLEATKRLRALQQTGTIPPFPIVAATSDVAANLAEAFLNGSLDGYLCKPLDLESLNDELHRVLPMRPADLHVD